MPKIKRLILWLLVWGAVLGHSTGFKVPLDPDASGERWVRKTLKRMTLEEKVGQMVCCRFSGRFMNGASDQRARLRDLILKHKVGGFILFGGDIYATAHLTNSLQRAASVPLLIASDLERGLGNQIEGATLFPPLMSLGATGSEDAAYRMGMITALEARAVGIHMTYAPVVDVNVNPDNPIINVRSLGENPKEVSRLANAFIRGCQDNGLIATAKHFPGHGDTDQDSHSVLPTVSGDRDRLEQVELFPFRAVVEAGVRAVMTAHLHLPALDPTPKMPATLSRPVMTDLLRGDFGFQGLIVTDAMDMGGITTLYTASEAALMAVKAGVDIILISPEPEEVVRTLAEAVRSGEISRSRIDDSVRRILKAKAGLGLHKRRMVDIDALPRSVANSGYLQAARQIFERSITLVKNDGGIVPLDIKDGKIALLALSSDPGDFYAGRFFVREFSKRCAPSMAFYADAYTGQEFMQRAIKKASQSDAIVIALFSRLRSSKGSVGLDLRQLKLINDLAASEKPVVVVSFGSPYFVRNFPEVEAYLCAYRFARDSQAAAVRALFGDIAVSGKLPVSIPGYYPLGHGLELKPVR